MSKAELHKFDVRLSGVLNQEDAETIHRGLLNPQKGYAEPREIILVWRNMIYFTLLHIAALHGLWWQ